MDWVTVFSLWTPISVAALLAFALILLAIAGLAWMFRDGIRSWFASRFAETTTVNGFHTAITATGIWLYSLGTSTPVPFLPVALAYAYAIYKIFQTDDTPPNPT